MLLLTTLLTLERFPVLPPFLTLPWPKKPRLLLTFVPSNGSVGLLCLDPLAVCALDLFEVFLDLFLDLLLDPARV